MKLRESRIRVSKLHLSSALKVHPTAQVRQWLRRFADDTYLHQVVARHPDGRVTRHRDLGPALAGHNQLPPALSEEWRIHFHVPLHSQPSPEFETTADHLQGAFDWLRANPRACSHLEMETYTWEVMPPELRSRSVVDQLVAEYTWCLSELRHRGLA
jgi:hypothetical protein